MISLASNTAENLGLSPIDPFSANRFKPLISILLPDLRGGGVERVAVNLANGFARRGYAVDMVLLSASGELLSELNPEVRIVDLNVPRMRGSLIPLVRYLRNARPDTFLACMWPLTVIALWAQSALACAFGGGGAHHWSPDECLRRGRRWKVGGYLHFEAPFLSVGRRHHCCL